MSGNTAIEQSPSGADSSSPDVTGANFSESLRRSREKVDKLVEIKDSREVTEKNRAKLRKKAQKAEYLRQYDEDIRENTPSKIAEIAQEIERKVSNLDLSFIRFEDALVQAEYLFKHSRSGHSRSYGGIPFSKQPHSQWGPRAHALIDELQKRGIKTYVKCETYHKDSPLKGGRGVTTRDYKLFVLIPGLERLIPERLPHGYADPAKKALPEKEGIFTDAELRIMDSRRRSSWDADIW